MEGSFFRKNQTIETTTREPIKILKFLGAGSQGEVYKVLYNGKEMALKFYKTMGNNPQQFYNNLIDNVKKGSPGESFLWPLAVTKKISGSCGYIMNLRPDNYFEITKFIMNKVRFPSFKATIEACLQIVSAFRVLHNRGYSYQDLNSANFFINPDTADVLICDNDNVSPDGVNLGILGTPRYMAPEIVLGKSMPNSKSDRYSLAVLLFILLCNNHPLEGKNYITCPCLSEANVRKIYGSSATFIFDKNDSSNRPVQGIHNNVIKRWPYLPTYMQDLFELAFSKSVLQEPSKRIPEKDWLNAFTRFRSEIVRCSCGNEIFINDCDKIVCDKCKKKVVFENKIVLKDYSFPVSKGAVIFRNQFAISNPEKALDKIIQIVTKTDKGKMIYGWKNVSGETLKAITTKGEERFIKKDEVAPVKAGIEVFLDTNKIKFE